jgi:hypothetical protein
MNIPYLYSRLLLFCAAMVVLNACKKPKADDEDTGEYVVKEVNYTKTQTGNSYEYNASWQLTKKTYSYVFSPGTTAKQTTTYSYNSDGRLAGTEYFMTAPNYDYYQNEEYGYNSQGRLITKKTFDKETGKTIATDEYVYNDKTIIQTHHVNTVIEYVRTVTLDDNGNIIKSVTDYTFPGSADITEEWLDYDDKKLFAGPAAGDVTSKNNYRKFIYRYEQQPLAELEVRYTYNKAGYVTSFMQIRTSDKFVLEAAEVGLIPKN